MAQSITSTGSIQDVPKHAPDLSIIIVSWNVKELVLNCLRTLFSDEAKGNLPSEVIVIDNDSSDGTVEAIREFEGVVVIEVGQNLGYGRANNIGFDLASGRHLLVLNPDTVPQPGSLGALLEFMDSHPGAGLVSPQLLNQDGSLQEAAFKFPTLTMALLDLFEMPALIPGRLRLALLKSWVNGRYRAEQHTTRPFRIDHPLGACMLVRGEAYRQVGGFDPAIFMYAEEIDLALRFAEAGWESWQVPAAKVVHLGGQSTRQMPDRMFVELWRSRLYVYDRHYSPLSRVGLRGILAVSQIWEAVKALVEMRHRTTTREDARRRWKRSGAVLKLVFRK